MASDDEDYEAIIGSQKYSDNFEIDDYNDEDDDEDDDDADFEVLSSSGKGEGRSNWKIYLSVVSCVLFFSMIMVFYAPQSTTQKESTTGGGGGAGEIFPLSSSSSVSSSSSSSIPKNNNIKQSATSNDPPKKATKKESHVILTIDSLRSYFAPISGISAVHSESSPQFKAIEWIVQNGLYEFSELLEVYILSTFFYSLDGPNWKDSNNFMDPSASVCDWHSAEDGVRCGIDAGQTVANIQFSGNGLKGTIPSEIRYLSHLRSIIMTTNKIEGTIPTEIGYLSNLMHLDFHRNFITGKIPTQIGNIASNHDLDIYINLAENKLTGTIPSEIGNIYGLKALFLNKNQLHGTLPSQDMSRLSRLHKFNLAVNKLRGRLDKFNFDQLSSLEYLWLGNNHLTGKIPSGLGLLPIDTMKIIELQDNFFHGALPSEISLLTNLERFWFQDNQVVGSVDNIVCTDSFATESTSIRADSCNITSTLLKCSCCCCSSKKKNNTCT